MAFEEIIAKCIEDKSFVSHVMQNAQSFGLSSEELALLTETDFSAFGFQSDERSALSVLSMWGATLN